MYINQRNQIESSKISAEEVDNIEVYVTKIYMWKEVTGEALPKFQNINDAPDKWVWEVVKKNMEKYEDITFEEIQEKAKEILLDLAVDDFSAILKNGHVGYEHERLYVFGKDVELLERVGDANKEVSLYIKFNKLDNFYVIVVSLHEQKYPIQYYFK